MSEAMRAAISAMSVDGLDLLDPTFDQADRILDIPTSPESAKGLREETAAKAAHSLPELFFLVFRCLQRLPVVGDSLPASLDLRLVLLSPRRRFEALHIAKVDVSSALQRVNVLVALRAERDEIGQLLFSNSLVGPVMEESGRLVGSPAENAALGQARCSVTRLCLLPSRRAEEVVVVSIAKPPKTNFSRFLPGADTSR